MHKEGSRDFSLNEGQSVNEEDDSLLSAKKTILKGQLSVCLRI